MKKPATGRSRSGSFKTRIELTQSAVDFYQLGFAGGTGAPGHAGVASGGVGF